MPTVPDHSSVPACRFALCNVCTSCGRVYHGGGTECVRCFIGAPSKPRHVETLVARDFGGNYDHPSSADIDGLLSDLHAQVPDNTAVLAVYSAPEPCGNVPQRLRVPRRARSHAGMTDPSASGPLVPGEDAGYGLGAGLVPIARDGLWPVVATTDEPDPEAALEAHVALVRALRLHRYPHPASHAYQDALAGALDSAVTIIVTHAMLDFVLDRMAHVPYGQALDKDMLPFPAAFVVMPRPVVVEVDRDEEATVRPQHVLAQFDYGAWIQTIDVTDPADGSGLPADGWADDPVFPGGVTYGQAYKHRAGIGYFALCAEASVKRAIDVAKAQGAMAANAGDYTIGAPLPVYSNGWRYGLTWDPAHRGPDFTLTKAGEWERRFWLAMWATLHEQVDPERPHLSRAAVRRAMRGREDYPEVVVCNLRMLTKTDPDGTERQVRPKPDWNHRWRVRGHDRTIHRGTDQERVVRVRPHVKGPNWAPIVEKDRVYRLGR